MGGGTAVAGDAAGVVLLGDRLGQVDEALALGRSTLGKIRQNLGWAGEGGGPGVGLGAGGGSFGCISRYAAVGGCLLAAPGGRGVPVASPPLRSVAYNFVGVALAAGALLPAYGIALSPSLAGGMMALSSIAVVTNSLSLRWAIDAASQQQQHQAQQQQAQQQPVGAPTSS